MADQKYINGIFATKKEGIYGEYVSVGITEEGLKAISALPKNGDFRNFTLNPQKNNPEKYSAKPQGSKNAGDSNDRDLPF